MVKLRMFVHRENSDQPRSQLLWIPFISFIGGQGHSWPLLHKHLNMNDNILFIRNIDTDSNRVFFVPKYCYK